MLHIENEQSRWAPVMSEAKSARQIVDEAYVAMLGNGDIDGFLVDFDESSELVEAASLPYGGSFRGPAAIKAAITRVFDYWKDFSFEVEHIVYGEESVMAYGRFRATAIATGRSVDMPLAEIWLIRNGKVTKVSPIYSDTKLALDALG